MSCSLGARDFACRFHYVVYGQGRYFIYVDTSYMIPIVYRYIPRYLVCVSVFAYLCVLDCLNVLAYFNCLSVLACLNVLVYFSYLACLSVLGLL